MALTGWRRVSTALRAAPTVSDMLPIFLQQAAEMTSAVVSTISMVEAEKVDLVLRGAYPPDDKLLGLRQSAGAGIAGHVAETGEMHVGRDQPHEFAPEELHLLTAVAEIAGSALQRANLLETLEQRVSERTRALAEANAHLTGLDHLKDQFISNVSHELRSPLTNIKLHLSLLERRGTDAIGRNLTIIQRETARLRRLIEDLLDLSRLQAQIAAPNRQPQRMNGLVAKIVASHVARGLSFVRTPATPPIEAPLDRAQMLQVFTNLIGNAIAYTPQGGGVEITSRAATQSDVPGVLITFKNWPVIII